MSDIEILNGISWHLECMALAAAAIDNFHPPADSFKMRMHYSLYITNLMSAIDMTYEKYGLPFQEVLKENLTTSSFSGAEILGYIRELRNGIVHRGINPTSGGMVVGGVVCAMAPPTVQNRRGSPSYAAPAPLLRDIFLHCEIGTKPTIEHFLEAGFKEVASVKSEVVLNEALNIIAATPHIPDWAKEMARKNLTKEMLVKAQTHQMERLRGLLKPRTGPRIA